MDEREKALRQDGSLIGIAVSGLINGSHSSPWFDLFAGPIASVVSGFFFGSPILTLYFVSLCVSIFTILLAGIPAAIYETNNGMTESSVKSLTIWLITALLLALPALAKMIGFW
jgi:hypothetical protein